jgi:hypothetical protein
MDLFDVNSLSSEHKFMLMIQERLDLLEDEKRRLENQLCELKCSMKWDNVPHPKPQRLTCNDWGERAPCAFIQMRLADESSVKACASAIKSMDVVKSFGYCSSPSVHMVDWPIDDDDVDVDDSIAFDAITGAFSVQALVTFDRTITVSAFGAELCRLLPSDSMECIYIHPLSAGSVGDDKTPYGWYSYHIVAGQRGSRPNIVCDGECEEWYCDGKDCVKDFPFRYDYKSDFDELTTRLVESGAYETLLMPWVERQ